MRRVVVVAWWALACERAPTPPDTALRELHEQLLAAKHASYSAADGAGSARLVSAPDVRAGELGEWVIEYSVGPLGIAHGGALFFHASPFWGWSDPQTVDARGQGYTEVTTEPASQALRCEAIGQQCLIVHAEDAVAPGTVIRIVYGKGRSASADRFAEPEESFYLWLDGDGDGTRKIIDADLHFAVRPRPAALLLVTGPSTAAVGEAIAITIASVDDVGNAAPDFAGTVTLRTHHLDAPTQVEFTPAHGGTQRIEVRASSAGTAWLEATALDRTARSNPIVVSAHPRRLLWADLQQHSALSDGTGTPESLYAYARDVAALDVCAVTDHDHHGMRKLDETPAIWQRIERVANECYEPGRFVTLIGFEWTSWLWGHRHVLYFGSEGELYCNLDPRTDTPPKLWRMLHGKNAITIAHHTGGGPVAIDWSFAPPSEIEPVVEIVSVHGSSEEPSGPRPIYAPKPGHFARDALERGYRLGFIGSGDGHDGHPGMAHLNGPSGGLAALWCEERTREAVAKALHAHACYATSGPRIYLEVRVNNGESGGEVAIDRGVVFHVTVAGTAPLGTIDLIKNGTIVQRQRLDGADEARVDLQDPRPRAGDWAYVRVIQRDEHFACSSPVWYR